MPTKDEVQNRIVKQSIALREMLDKAPKVNQFWNSVNHLRIISISILILSILQFLNSYNLAKSQAFVDREIIWAPTGYFLTNGTNSPKIIEIGFRDGDGAVFWRAK